MAKHRLPIGLQTFRKIRERNCYYVDKTAFALRLVEEGDSYFLSRPRRFGKSLFLDTLKELSSGSRELFEGLYAFDRWDWSVRRPLLRLDLAAVRSSDVDVLTMDVRDQLGALERDASMERHAEGESGRLRDLIRGLHRRTGQRVTVLVDEYDRPILDEIGRPETARANRAYLCSLYSVIKSCDQHICFCFLTGVSNFSKGSLFSGLNSLIDISLEPDFSTICGYTEQDLDTVFAPELEGLDRDLIRSWYDGYSWGGPERVYNPFDALLLFRKREYKAWWFETGTPSFLVQTLVKRNFPCPALECMAVGESRLGEFDVGEIGVEALLFQSGYLTVLGVELHRGRLRYQLGYPNQEVRTSLSESLLDYLTGNPRRREDDSDRLYDLLLDGDIAGLEGQFRSLFARVPHQWHTSNPIRRYEWYYASVFYAHCATLGQPVILEESSSRGRLDVSLRMGGRMYLFEFKVVERAGKGAVLAQLKARGYADKYRHLGVPIYLVGVEFSEEKRNVDRFGAELI